jgi:hypothetical protein
MQLLLDKGIVRRYTEGYWRSVRSQPLTPEQRIAQDLLSVPFAGRFFISPELVNLLRLRVPLLAVEQIRPFLHVLIPTKYQRRWARRLHQDFGFGREDAHLLSLATFGTDLSGATFGVDLFVTFDLKLLDRFGENFPVIKSRFSRMVSHLSDPYMTAKLPAVVTPTEALALLSPMAAE